MDTNLFETLEPEDHPTLDETKNYLEELVGDGKKFKTVDDLAKGKALADQTVEILKTRLDETRKELETRMSLETFKTELEALRKQPSPPTEQEDVLPDVQKQELLNDSKLEALVDSLLERRDQKRRAETNIEKVSRVLQENFGDQAKLVLNRKAQELDVPLADLQSIAVKSPTMFFQLIGASETPQQGQRPIVPKSQVNLNPPQNFSPSRGRSYYERLKRENPKEYFDQKVTVQMMKDMAALGKEKFEAS